MSNKTNKQSESLKEAPALNSGIVASFPTPPARKAEEYLNAYSGYAYTAISAIAQEVASIKLLLYKIKYLKNGDTETDEIKQHDILSFLAYINPLMTFYDLVEATQTYLELVGEAFWIVLREGNNGKPKEAYLVRPDWMHIVTGGPKIIDHYVYKPGGVDAEKIKVPRENVIHFKYFNPTNPYRGKGSIQAAAMPLDVFTFASDWTRNFFFNSATPGLVFTTEKKLDERVIKRFIEQWRATHEGRDKSHKIAFLGGGFKIDKTSLTPTEMSFGELQKQMRDDILAVFKVPKTVLGLTEDVNRANAEATTRAFMERVITPRMKKFVGVLNEFLLPMFGAENNVFIDFVDPSPEDVEQKLKRYESGRKYGWLTPNEIRAEENLEPIEGGDLLSEPKAKPQADPNSDKEDPELDQENEDQEDEDIEEGKEYIPHVKQAKKKIVKHMVDIPKKRPELLEKEQLTSDLTKSLVKIIGDMVKDKNFGEKKEIVKEEVMSENKFAMNEEQKDLYWKKLISKTDPWEAVVSKIVLNIFEEEEKVVLSNISGAKDWRAEKRKGNETSFLQSLAEMAKPWIQNLVPYMREILYEAGRDVLDFLGVGGEIDLTTNDAQKYLRQLSSELIDDINKTTREKLKKTLSDGFGKGESVKELSDRVEDVFSEAKTSRAKMIARTEVLGASNYAAILAYKQSGFVTGKEWLTAVDERVCPFCGAMDGKILDLDVNYFKKGETFNVTDDKGKTHTLKLERSAIGNPPLHPNCRCTTIPFMARKGWVPKAKIESTNEPAPIDKILTLISDTLNEEVSIIKNDLEAKSAQFLKEKEIELKKEYQFNKKINLSTANKLGIKLVMDANKKADALVKEVKNKIKEEQLDLDLEKKAIAKAKEEAKILIEQAKKSAVEIKERAKHEAEVEKNEMLAELVTLRNKVKEAIKQT